MPAVAISLTLLVSTLPWFHPYSAYFYIFYAHAFDVFFIPKSVPALKLILSLCITDEGQTKRWQDRVKVVSGKMVQQQLFFVFFLQVRAKMNKTRRKKQRGGEQREGRLPRQFTVTANYTQLTRCCFLANLKVEADLWIGDERDMILNVLHLEIRHSFSSVSSMAPVNDCCSWRLPNSLTCLTLEAACLQDLQSSERYCFFHFPKAKSPRREILDMAKAVCRRDLHLFLLLPEWHDVSFCVSLSCLLICCSLLLAAKLIETHKYFLGFLIVFVSR